tara:strand:+ start:339 stop:650 length:312 start_codon:yes stop_codon:yes gene_type:complete
MNESKIKSLQRKYNYKIIQDLIDSGEAWKIGGSITQKCKDALQSGACYLPVISHSISIFLVVPSRYEVPKGAVGSIERSKEYWKDLWNVSYEIGKKMTQPALI